MDGEGDSERRRGRIDGAAKAAFLAAVRRGVPLEAAAAEAGASLQGLYGARQRDRAFAAEWVEALAQSAEEERAGVCPHCGSAVGEEKVAPNNRRRLQKRRIRKLRFDARRKERFLAHFASSCDVEAAARAVGVDATTVFKHRRKDPAFAAAFDEALAQGYARLEAEALRQRLEAQKRMRRALDDGVPSGEIAAEFERVLKLLQRWDRKCERPGVRAVARSRKPALSFEESLALLERKLRNLDIPILKLPPDIARRYDGDEDGWGDE
jgi:hypothetical protein